MIQKGKQISIRRTDYERKVTNNYINTLDRKYNPQPLDTKKITIDVTDEEDFKTLYFAFLKVAFGITLSEARLLYSFLSITGNNYEIYATDSVFKLMANYCGNEVGSMRNEFYKLCSAKVFERIGEGKYRLKEEYFMPFNNKDKRLIVDLNLKIDE